MPKYIINLRDEKQDKDNFMEWSTIVDAPTTYGCDLDSFKEYYKKEYGNKGMEELDSRLARVSETGTSSRVDKSLDNLISYNRAGEKENHLNKEELLEEYCRPYYKDRK